MSRLAVARLSAPRLCRGFFPAKRVMSEDELAKLIQSIRDIKPTSAFHEKQLAQVISHLESENSANIQLVLVPASANIDGIEHQRDTLCSWQACWLDLCSLSAVPVSRGYVHIDSAGKSSPASQEAKTFN